MTTMASLADVTPPIALGALDVSPATVERDWTVSKAWLLQRLSSLPGQNGR